MLALGAYYVGQCAVLLFTVLVSPLTNQMSFEEGLPAIVSMPLALSLPSALAAYGVGYVVARTVESPSPTAWATLPAALFLVLGISPSRWAAMSSIGDRVSQIIEAAVPALACILAAQLVERRRVAGKLPNTDPTNA